MTASERADRERLLVVPRVAPPEPARDGEEPRYLLVRWADWPQPALLSIAPPAASDSLDDAVATLLHARLRVAVDGPVRVGTGRVPVRMAQPRFGLGGTTGWLRPAVVDVRGEPEPDALLGGYDSLTLAEALAALSTEVERTVLRDGAALFGAEQ
jgi:hypothetical protein